MSHVKDSAGRSWLSSTARGASETASKKAWVVIVDMPDADAEAHRYRYADGEPYLDNYLVRWDVLNSYRPFRAEPVTED